jgi:uncharacterized membrane-anchored protein YhcB (DUF1043 family)
MDRILRLEVRLDNLTEQVKVDHQQLLLGLETQHQALIKELNEQKNLLAEHFAKSERRFDELTSIVKDLAHYTYQDVTDEIVDIKKRLDRLENPAA